MANIKLNNNLLEEDFEVIPDLSETNGEKSSENQEEMYIIKDDNGKKLFANKKANKALIITGSIFAALLVALVIFVYI